MEMREKIASKLEEWNCIRRFLSREEVLKMTDQILALFPQQEESFNEELWQVRDEVMDIFNKYVSKFPLPVKKEIEELKGDWVTDEQKMAKMENKINELCRSLNDLRKETK